MRVRLRGTLCYLRAVSWCSAMTTKVCMNSNCRGYAHFVYTVAMRCVLCRCDLIAARSVEAAGTIVSTQPKSSEHQSEHHIRTLPEVRQTPSRSWSEVERQGGRCQH